MKQIITKQKSVSPLIEKVFVAVLILLCLLQVGRYAVWMPLTIHGIDYGKHHIAARQIIEGKSPYIGENYLSFNYPVFTAVIYTWLAAFDFETGETAWDIGNGLLIILSALMVSLWYKPESAKRIEPSTTSQKVLAEFRQFLSDRWWVVGFFLTLYYLPVIVRMFDGNIEPTMLILMVAFGAALLNRRHKLAGVFLAFASLVKVLPVFLIIVFIIGKRWRVLLGFLTVMFVYFIFLIATGWWRWEWFFVSDVLPNAPSRWQEVSFSLASFTAGIFYPAAIEEGAKFKLWSTLVNLCFVIPVTIGVLIISRKALKKWFLLGVGFTALSLPLLTPLLEYHHHVWAIVAYFFVIKLWLEGKISRIFYLQVPFWIILLGAGYAMNVRPSILWLHPYKAAMLSVLILWLISGAELLWLGLKENAGRGT